MRPFTRYLALPILFTVAILVIAYLPPELVSAIGCRNRGLWAVTIALTSGVLGITSAGAAIVGKARGGRTGWLMISALVYALPLVVVLLLK